MPQDARGLWNAENSDVFVNNLEQGPKGCPTSLDHHHFIDWVPARQSTTTHRNGTCLFCRLVFVSRGVKV